jgi:hypothetical protein
MKLAVVILSGLLVLTGCSSSAVSQEQTIKLLEYEKCISAEEASSVALVRFSSRDAMAQYFKDIEKEGLLVESFLEACAKYRP